MKATGIVRRIDDLGRVMMPKEIRRTLRIREGDPLEIFVEDGCVIYKKYSVVKALGDFAKSYIDSLYQITGIPCIVTDMDNVICVAGLPQKDYLYKEINSFLRGKIDNRDLFQNNQGSITIVENQLKVFESISMCPIISNGDLIGSIMFVSFDDSTAMDETESKLLQTAALFLGKQNEL